MTKPPVRHAALAVLLAAALVAPAQAQATRNQPETRITIPKPRGELKGTPIMSILTAVVLGAGIVSITLLPSKRGHQD